MTEFNGVKRVTRWPYRTAHTDAREIVFQLGVGDVITVREAGRRTSWTMPADRVARFIIQASGKSDQEKGQE